MPVPLAVPIILGAASIFSSLFGAKKQSDASQKAAQLQSAAADKAIAAQQQGLDRQLPIYEQVYRDQRAGMDPYAQVGRNAMGTLGRLMTPGMAYSPGMQAMDAQANTMRPTAYAPQPIPIGRPSAEFPMGPGYPPNGNTGVAGPIGPQGPMTPPFAPSRIPPARQASKRTLGRVMAKRA